MVLRKLKLLILGFAETRMQNFFQLIYGILQGTLPDGRMIAVKDLMVTSQHGKSQFMAEIATISAVQHRNLVKLLGFCIKESKRLLVYEYLENKSLDHALFGMKIFKLLACYTAWKL